MRFGPAARSGVLLGLALALSGCGDGGEPAADGGQATKRAAPASAAARAAPVDLSANPRRRAAAAARRCGRTLGDFLDSMESLANTVAVGLDYENYLDTVKRVRGSYAGVDADRLALACLGRVAGPAEQSLNAHIEAANAWGDCLADSSCELGAVEPRLQRSWEAAADLLGKARRGLSRLR
jgi:hypothetical protein